MIDFERITEIRRNRNRGIFHLLFHSPRWPQQSGLGQTAARTLEFHPGLPSGYRDLNAWAISCCFPRSLRGSCHRVEQQGCNPVPKWDASLSDGCLTHCATTFGPSFMLVSEGSRGVPALFTEELTFLYCVRLPLSRTRRLWVYFWALCAIELSILLPVPHHLD